MNLITKVVQRFGGGEDSVKKIESILQRYRKNIPRMPQCTYAGTCGGVCRVVVAVARSGRFWWRVVEWVITSYTSSSCAGVAYKEV